MPHSSAGAVAALPETNSDADSGKAPDNSTSLSVAAPSGEENPTAIIANSVAVKNNVNPTSALAAPAAAVQKTRPARSKKRAAAELAVDDDAAKAPPTKRAAVQKTRPARSSRKRAAAAERAVNDDTAKAPPTKRVTRSAAAVAAAVEQVICGSKKKTPDSQDDSWQQNYELLCPFGFVVDSVKLDQWVKNAFTTTTWRAKLRQSRKSV
jgi:hypothetical protein